MGFVHCLLLFPTFLLPYAWGWPVRTWHRLPTPWMVVACLLLSNILICSLFPGTLLSVPVFNHIESEWDIMKHGGLQKSHIFLMRWIWVYPCLSPTCILLWFLGWKGESEWKLASWAPSLPQTWRSHPKPDALCTMCISSLKTTSSENLILVCKTLWWHPGITTNCHALPKLAQDQPSPGPARLEWHRPLWK